MGELRQEVFVSGSREQPVEHAIPARIEEPAAESEGRVSTTPSSDARAKNKEFWERFIASVRFDHPDQTAPRHGSNNYVRVDLPGPVTGMVAYRVADGRTGLVVKFTGPEGRGFMQGLLEDQAGLEGELGCVFR